MKRIKLLGLVSICLVGLFGCVKESEPVIEKEEDKTFITVDGTNGNNIIGEKPETDSSLNDNNSISTDSNLSNRDMLYNEYKNDVYKHLADNWACYGNNELCTNLIKEAEDYLPDDIETIIASTTQTNLIESTSEDYSYYKEFMKGKPMDIEIRNNTTGDYIGLTSYGYDEFILVHSITEMDTILHELGHAYEYSYWTLGLDNPSSAQEWKDSFNSEYVSEYGRTSIMEFYAESFSMYFLNPDQLKSSAPKAYELLENDIRYYTGEPTIQDTEDDDTTLEEDDEKYIDTDDFDTEDDTEWYIDEDGNELEGIPSDYEPEYGIGEENNDNYTEENYGALTIEQFEDLYNVIMNSGFKIELSQFMPENKTFTFYFDSNSVTAKYACDSAEQIANIIRDYLNTNGITDSDGYTYYVYFSDLNPDFSYEGQNGFEIMIENSNDLFDVAERVSNHYNKLLPTIVNEFNPYNYPVNTNVFVDTSADDYGRINYYVDIDIQGQTNNIDAHNLAVKILKENSGFDNYVYVRILNNGEILSMTTNDSVVGNDKTSWYY